MQMKGRIKFADPVKGYGYILNDDAQSPTDTVLFKMSDLKGDVEVLYSGCPVEYEVDDTSFLARATEVRTLA